MGDCRLCLDSRVLGTGEINFIRNDPSILDPASVQDVGQ